MPEIIYTSGLTGFIGKNLLPLLKNKYKYILNFKRNNIVEIISSSKNQSYDLSKDILKEYPSAKFLNLATYYNPSPENVNILKEVIEANIFFPLRIIKKINSKNLTLINTSSYMQLLDNEIQNEYALSKQIFLNRMKRLSNNIINIYLYDSFGKEDTRNKVVDVFIKRILNYEDILIPVNDIEINLSSVDDTCNSLMGSFDLDYGEYSIFSNNTIKLYDLILVLEKLIGNKAKVIRKNKSINMLPKILRSPKNIYMPLNNKSFEDKLTERIDEIKRANSL